MTDTIDVLLVDEDAEVLDLAQTFLERKSDSLVVETETNPVTAVDRAVEGGVDCVVSDYRMPTMNGLELCAAIHERVELPFFLFTGASNVETDSDDPEAPVTGSVQKGAGTDHYDELVERIGAAFE